MNTEHTTLDLGLLGETPAILIYEDGRVNDIVIEGMVLSPRLLFNLIEKVENEQRLG